MNQNNISLEKVIKGLEYHSEGNCFKSDDDETECPYWKDSFCSQHLCSDALALLKAQKPRVMTWEEAQANVNEGPFIIFEVRDSTGSELDFGVLVDDSYEMSEGSLLTVEFFPKMEDEYGKRFRMWTSRPTEAEREAVKWDG